MMDKIFSMMDADPDMGPKLRDADTPQRFEFSDFDLVVNIRATRGDEEGNLLLGVDGRRRLGPAGPDDDVVRGRQPLLPGQGERPDGDRAPADQVRRRPKAALALIPITKPIYDQYRDYVEREKPHLKV